MRQLKLISTPTGNSIAPVLEMLEAGIYLCIGSDNIADICSPAGTPDLIDEIYVLANALRFYDIDILAKLASGRKLDPTDRELISEHLEHNLAEMENAQNYHPPI